MKTTMFKRVFAMLMIVMVLVSMFAVNTFAANSDDDDVALSACDTLTDATQIEVCEKLAESLGSSSKIYFRTEKPGEDETSPCKYASSVQVDGVQITVYLSQKPTTGQVGVQIEDGKLVVDGISSDDGSAWNQLFDRFKGIIVGLTGVGTLVMIVLFIIQFMKLGSSAGNPQARSQALTGVLWTGVAAALLGSVTIIVGFFYNAI